MKLLTSGWALAIIAALLNIGTSAGLIYLQREALFVAAAKGHLQQEAAAQRKPRFWSFRPDEVEGLITELKSEREKLNKRQSELEKVAAHIDSEKQELEKTRSDIAAMRDEMSAEIPEVQDSEHKNLKTLSQTYANMPPTASVAIFRQMDDGICVKLLSLMKPDKVGAILQEMSVQDKDGSMTKRAARISDKLRLVKAEQKPQS